MFVFQTGTSRLLNPAIVHELVFNPNPIESCGERRGNVPHPSGQCHEQRGVSRCQLLALAGPSGNLKSPCQGEGSHRSRCWAAERFGFRDSNSLWWAPSSFSWWEAGGGWGLCCPPLAASFALLGRVVTGLWLQAGLLKEATLPTYEDLWRSRQTLGSDADLR